MTDRGQSITCFAGEFRIVREELDRPFDLIPSALPRSVSAGEEFKVFDSIVGSIAIDVVNRFFSAKWAPYFLLHVVAVFVDIVAANSADRWKSKQNVPTHHSFRHRAFCAWAKLFVFRDQRLALKRVAACRAARFGAAQAMAENSEFLTADCAVLRFGAGSADVRAFSRTVERVFFELLVVFSQFSRSSVEWFAASPARKFDFGDFLFRSAVFVFVSAVARYATVFAAYLDVSLVGAKKRAAVLARLVSLFGVHFRLLIVNADEYHTYWLMSTGISEGSL